jgi:predicted Zn-dependent peptidase
MNVVQHTLKNGIKTVIIELPHRNLVSTAVFVGAGGRYEEYDSFGISHFVEHMVFKGTKKYPDYEKVALAVEMYGGEENGGTSKDNTYYTNTVRPKFYKEAFDVLGQEVGAPLFDEKEIEKEKGVVIEEIHQDNDDPADFAARRMGELLWGNHPLGCDILGPIENIHKFNKKDLENYFRKHYNSENMAIAVAGNIKAEEAIPELEKAFGIVPGGKKIVPQQADMTQAESQVAVYSQEIEQGHVYYAFKAFPHSDKRRYALDVLLSVLGKGAGSELYKIVREEQGLAYAIGTFNRYMTDAGFCGVYAGLNVDSAPEAVAMIKKTIFEAKEKLYSPDEILRAKEYLKGLFIMNNLENTADIAYYYGRKELLYPQDPSYQERGKLLDAVTAEEVREVAREIFRTEKENLVVVGPYEDKEIFVKMLGKVK